MKLSKGQLPLQIVAIDKRYLSSHLRTRESIDNKGTHMTVIVIQSRQLIFGPPTYNNPR